MLITLQSKLMRKREIAPEKKLFCFLRNTSKKSFFIENLPAENVPFLSATFLCP